MFFDVHFVIEHVVRSCVGRFFNFNGMVGVWWCVVIEDVGGWEYDMLIEDLDFLYCV